MEKLVKAKLNHIYLIDKIDTESNPELGIRLMHLGFLPNEKISVLKKTPITSDALLINVRGCQIALTKNEANIITIKE